MVKPLNKNMKSDDLYYYGGVSEGLVVFTFPLTRGQDWFAKAGQYCNAMQRKGVEISHFNYYFAKV